jgi:hypothetical protein
VVTAVTGATGRLDLVLRRLVVVLVLLVGGVAAACSGDDGATVSDAPPSSVGQPGVTGGDPAVSGTAGDCEALQVLLKVGLSDEERAEVEATVGELDGVTGVELQPAASDEEPQVLLVRTESEDATDAVGEALAGDPSVVSVVHPEQVC